MSRYKHLACQPQKGLKDVIKWKLNSKLPSRAAQKGFIPPQQNFDAGVFNQLRAAITWIGHASFCVKLAQHKIAIDPVLNMKITGVPKRLSQPGMSVDQLNTGLDTVLLSHNHYDHLDKWTLNQLRPKRFIVPAGNAKHIKTQAKVIELEWWQTITIDNAEITLVPAKHWSMRSATDRNRSLWGGYVIRDKTFGVSIYFSGDTAFMPDIAHIREKLGHIHIALLPIGAYEPRWMMKAQHANPQESADMFTLLDADVFIPMHWATYVLSDEPLEAPIHTIRSIFQQRQLETLLTPNIGEVIDLEAWCADSPI